ncbi:VWA domain-containing protein [Altererythrobacter sp. RZ02]|uniref:VWA domain-containing protein n=1 Tax=Pontixanthobacter rizhaonensis TaxID=2730337 RepID=A0A848QLE6_9SPHN|nr:VWA domain-containing protein [Pontixanthobacter rizhaonensis]NMW31964.1 VWA domain-containing protein [Pontixanthobacter rizhaonensis]
MRLIRISISTSILAILAGCAANPDGGTGDDLVTAPAPPVAVAPPPPPPPPPPLPAPAPMASADAIMVTGNRLGKSAAAGYVAESEAPAGSTATSAEVSPRYRYVPPVIIARDPGSEKYDGEEISSVKIAAAEPLSTFSVDVDTGAYANTRRFLSQGQMPPRAAVRTEEMINYFRYDYPKPADRSTPFSVNTDMAVTPWNANTRLLRIGLRGYDLPRNERPPANLVFLMDVSGSMGRPDKLPLVKTALAGLAGELSPQDKVSIVVYAGAAGLVLEPTSDERKIRRALDQLNAGGSTAGGAGIQLAYQIAEDNMIKGGVNRVILATDGDFNVGLRDRDALIELIEKKRDTGITLTTLGFGTGNYNEALMEQVANHGNGNYAYIDSALEAKKVLGDEMSSTLFTIAKDVKIQVEFNPAVVSQYRLIGYENRALRDEDFNNDAVDAGDIGAGHQVTSIYEIVPAGQTGWISPRRYGAGAPARIANPNTSEAAYIKLRYKMPDGKTSRLVDRIVPASGMRMAERPRGDFAFATAVAAFGQKLRGDPLLNDFDFGDIEKLAGTSGNYWRQEFARLADVADSLEAQSGG